MEANSCARSVQMIFSIDPGRYEEGMQAMFGDTLRAHRRAQGLTQESLAERALISEQAVGALERGDRRFPRRDTVTRLADALGLAGDARDRFAAAASRQGTPRPDLVCAARFAELEEAVHGLAAELRTLQHGPRAGE